MKKVATGMQNGAQIMELFGGSRKKKIFLLLPNSATTSTTTSSTTTSSTTTSSTITSATPATQSSTSTSSSAAPSTQSSTSASSSAPQSSASTIPVTQPSTSVTSSAVTLAVTSVPVTPAMLPPTSTPIHLISPPRNGASTRQYITALARAGGLTFDDSSDSSDSDSSHNDQNTNRLVATSSDSEDDHTDALGGEAQGPSLYGYVHDDLSIAGVVTDENVSRTTEVIKCIEALEEGGQNATLPFLTNTFKEFTWQGTEDSKVMVAVLLQLNCPLPSKRKLVSLLNNVVNSNCYLWISEHKSREADKVKVKYGLKNPKSSVLVLAPCHSRNMPQCVEIFNESNLQDDKLQESIAMAQDLCNAMKDEREKLEEWRQVRQEQDLQFQVAITTSCSCSSIKTCSTTTSTCSTKAITTTTTSITKTISSTSTTSTCTKPTTTPSGIRQDRSNRVPPEPEEGTTIILRSGGLKFERKFKRTALFQEEEDVKEFLESQVSFRGNLPQAKEDRLSATVVDEKEAQNTAAMQEKKEDQGEDKEEQHETKNLRKRKKDKRTGSKRKRSKKEQ